MDVIRVAFARIRALFRRNAIADEIREELQFHVEMRADEYARNGLDATEARAAALRRFGNPAVIHDRGYDVRGGGLLETIVQDLKYGVRQLRRQPFYSLLAILTLALGIGVSTALFSVIDAALLRPLPYPHPEELVGANVKEVRTENGDSMVAPSPDDIRTWRSVSTIVAHAGTGRVNGFVPLIVEAGAPQRLVVGSASEDFLETYGIPPILGRSIQEDDTRDGAPKVGILGHAFWQREFGGDRSVLGRVIRIENEPVTIVGVLPPGFFPRTAVWQAEQFTPFRLRNRGSGEEVIVRLRPGVTRAQAGAALDAVTAPGRVFGPKPAPSHVVLTSMYDEATGGYRPTIRTLSLAVAFIVLIACVNVAGLTLARGATRDVELAIRASIGAGRGRLLRQLLTESLLLAAIGAAAGVLIAYGSLDSLVALFPLSLPPSSPAAINATVLALALGLTALTALMFGLVPALKLSRAAQTIGTVVTAGGRAASPLSRRAGQWLMAVEVTLALVLMAGSGLLLRSFTRLLGVDLGYDPGKVLTLEVEPLEQSASVRRDYYHALADALRAVPGVAAVGAIDQLGLGGGGTYGFATADTGLAVEGMQHTVLPGYFDAMGVHPLSGRLLEAADEGATDQAVVVNAAAARKFFHGDAVGHTMRTPRPAPEGWRSMHIVGVVPDILHGGPEWGAKPALYVLPDPQGHDKYSSTMAMVMRLRDGASLPLVRLKEIANRPGPRVLVGEARSGDALVSDELEATRHRMVLLTLLGAFGLALTLVGIFSMTAYAVARRTREIGVRMALGARRSQVVGAMVRDAAWPVGLGIAAGLAGTYYATRLIASFLFHTEPHDPVTLGAVVALLAVAAFIAAWLPARRAAAVDPLIALRTE